MSLQTLADGHAHVIQCRECIGEVLFAGIFCSLIVSVTTTFRSMDEGTVSAVLNTNDMQRENEKRQQWETRNIDSQEGVLGLLSMGSAHNHVHFHQDKHQSWHQHHHHHPHNTSSLTTSSSSSRFRPAIPSLATLNLILTTTTFPHISSSLSPQFDSNVFPTVLTLMILAKQKQIYPSMQSLFENGHLRPYNPPRSAIAHLVPAPLEAFNCTCEYHCLSIVFPPSVIHQQTPTNSSIFIGYCLLSFFFSLVHPTEILCRWYGVMRLARAGSRRPI